MNNQIITKQEVLETQKAWGEGIVKIGNVFQENGDYSAAAASVGLNKTLPKRSAP